MQITKKTKISIAIFSSVSVLIIAAAVFFEVRRKAILNPSALTLSKSQKEKLYKNLDNLYPERKSRLHNLPYKTGEVFDINSESALVIDCNTGNIIYEKNADLLIPPASMTKIVEMAVIFDDIKKQKLNLNDIVPLPPESLAENLPYDASRMGLRKNDKVTLKTLLTGLAVASANDASIAVANYAAKNMEDFVLRMNLLVKSLGLKKTVFAESSGYSEKNLTTAREFTDFSLWYIKTFPESLTDYHSVKEFTYPLENGWTIKNTNRLLDELEGCDGLKTGYIDESGYNLALTAKRGRERFLSVIMRGPGKNTLEGNYYRRIDGRRLIEYGFNNFESYIPEEDFIYTISNPCCKEEAFNLIPAQDLSFTIPKRAGGKIKHKIIKPDFIDRAVKEGEALGKIIFYADNTALRTVDLVCDRSTNKKSGASLLTDKIIVWSLRRSR